MTMSSSSTSLRSSLNIIEVKPGLKFSEALLKELLPDVETALFFGKVYELDYHQLSNLLRVVLKSDIADALFSGDHSTELQDYLVDDLDWHGHVAGEITFAPEVAHGEILPELWKSLEVEVASSIKAVASKLASTLGLMPGKQGSMVFESMMAMNRRRPTIGDYKAKVYHAPVKENLVILDDSGSMTAPLIQTIIADVVSLSYMANAHLVLVSSTARHWAPGTYDVDTVMREAEYMGTHYEELHELLNQDWGVVVTIADYDSSPSAKGAIARSTGHIDEVVDISLVNRPSYLAEVVGQRADKVRPILVAQASSPQYLTN